jgi:lysophospholipase L1-like esterase
MKYLAVLCLFVFLQGSAFAGEPVTIFLAGDSTMAQKLPEKRPETGWGEALQEFFDAGKVRVENLAQNGRSTKTFIAEGLWQALVARLKKGDYVFIEFGHNDEAKEKIGRYTTPDEFRRNLLIFIADVREKQAIPILLTPVMRRRFNAQGVFFDTHGEYPDIVRSVAFQQKVALIDMHRKSEQVLKQYGPEGSRELFLQLKPGENANYPNGVEDNTHFSLLGAEKMAGLAVAGIKEQRLDLVKLLKSNATKMNPHGKILFRSKTRSFRERTCAPREKDSNDKSRVGPPRQTSLLSKRR